MMQYIGGNCEHSQFCRDTCEHCHHSPGFWSSLPVRHYDSTMMTLCWWWWPSVVVDQISTKIMSFSSLFHGGWFLFPSTIAWTYHQLFPHEQPLCPDSTICAPKAFDVLATIDQICVIIFVIEFSLRFLTVAFVPTRSLQLIIITLAVFIVIIILIIIVVVKSVHIFNLITLPNDRMTKWSHDLND